MTMPISSQVNVVYFGPLESTCLVGPGGLTGQQPRSSDCNCSRARERLIPAEGSFPELSGRRAAPTPRSDALTR
jgi:hypothetical protein